MKIDDFFVPNTITGDITPRLNWELIFTLPQYKDLEGCPQNTSWHQEGDAMRHTKNCVEALYSFFERHPYLHLSKELVLATLFHDLGKPSTTKKNQEGEWTSPCHGPVGARIVREILKDEPDILRRERVCSLVRDHMIMHHLFDKGKHPYRELLNLNHSYAPTNEFLYLNYADDFGSHSFYTDKDKYERLHKIEKLIDKYHMDKIIRFPGHYCKLSNCYGLSSKMFDCGNPDFTVIIMVGLPGSGKDTWIQTHYPEIPTVSRDKIREKLGFCKLGEKIVGNKIQENAVSEEFDKQVYTLCKSRKSFIINNTNLPRFRRRQIIEELLPYKPYITIVYVDTPLDVCKDRRKEQIPASAYRRMVDSFDFPMPNEVNRIIRVTPDGTQKVIWDDRNITTAHQKPNALFCKPWYARLYHWIKVKFF